MNYQKKYLKYKNKYLALKRDIENNKNNINLDGSGNFGSKAKSQVAPSPADMSLIDAEKQKAFKNLYKLISIDLERCVF
jgi:hypothetical protein